MIWGEIIVLLLKTDNCYIMYSPHSYKNLDNSNLENDNVWDESKLNWLSAKRSFNHCVHIRIKSNLYPNQLSFFGKIEPTSILQIAECPIEPYSNHRAQSTLKFYLKLVLDMLIFLYTLIITIKSIRLSLLFLFAIIV